MTAQQLKNSILQMAVQGKLVPQNPDDEPASVLLERIRAEKQKLIKEGKIKKDKKSSEIFRGSSRNLPYMYYEQVGKEIQDISDEIPFDIPDSWEWVRLGFISTYNQTKQKINAKDADISIWGLDLKDIEKGGKLLEKKTVGERKAVGDKTLFNKGDILYSKLRPYLLKILVAPDSGICTPEIVPFTIYGGIFAEYIVHFLKSPYVDGFVNGETYGIKMPRAGTETMISLLVSLPPLAEQHRIVSKIEELLPYIEKYDIAETKLSALNTTFPEALKKSILQEAVQGKLVPQNPDDEPASVLLERIRAEKQALIKAGKIKKDKHESVIVTRDKIPYEIPDSWYWCRLADIIIGIETGKSIKCIESPPNSNEIGIIKVSAVSWGRFNENESKTCIDTKLWKEQFAIHIGDFIMSRANTTELVGSCVIVNFLSKKLMLSDKTLRIVFSENIYKKYILYLLRSTNLRNQIEHSASGTSSSMKNISQDAIRELLISLPPLAEQKRIVEKIDELMQYCDKLK